MKKDQLYTKQKYQPEYKRFDNVDKSLITRSYWSDLLTNFRGIFKIYRSYLFSNLALTIILLILPICLSFVTFAILPNSLIIILPFYSLFFLSFIFLPLIIIDFRNSTIIKRIGATDITRYYFIIYLTLINIIISFLFFFFILFVLLPIFNLFYIMLPWQFYYNSAAGQSWLIWSKIDYFRLFLLIIIFSMLGSQLGIFLGMILKNKTLVLFLGLLISVAFMFMAGIFFSGWFLSVSSSNNFVNFPNWIYTLTPFTFVGRATVATMFGYTNWLAWLNALFVGFIFSLLFFASSKWWLSFSSIR